MVTPHSAIASIFSNVRSPLEYHVCDRLCSIVYAIASIFPKVRSPSCRLG
ncbi:MULTISPECIES: hypothetical protein [unclassified Coleofasciculus]|nr:MULTISPECIES: hypothetical protein [unclassified Coleofasciculus]MBE9127425.1 hypothetical protein [Coleofasciculus sp. LEGE 07081]MBE9149248.1 hypothetical protein [Coleofasciculus sp. LEGE 07092]